MEKDNQYKIEQYLNDAFTEAERVAFEKELVQDAALREELGFAKDLHQFFNDRNPALEENLSQFDKTYFEDDSSVPPPNNSWWKIAVGSLIALVVVLGAWWMITDIKQNKPDTLSPEPKEKKEIQPKIEEQETKVPASEIEEEPASNSKPEQEIIQESKEVKEPKQETPKKEKKEITQPIAALNPEDFTTNPILESLIKEHVRNEEIKTTLIEPALDLALKHEAQTLLKIKGTTNAAPPLILTIYTNDSEDFDNNKPYLNTEISTTEKDGEEYEFQFNAKMNFEQGLYYFLIESVETEDLLIVSKFQVK